MAEGGSKNDVMDAFDAVTLDCKVGRALADLIGEVQKSPDGGTSVHFAAYEIESKLNAIERNAEVIFDAWRQVQGETTK